MKWEKFNKLDYLSQTFDNSQVCVVLFHGYGADASDLAGLANVFQLPQPVDWFFPQGVLQVPIGPMMSGRAWFQLRVSDFDDLAQGNSLPGAVNEETEKVISQAVEWLNHLGRQYEKVIIGGFSQGAILTSHAFYRLNFSPRALLLLSGYLVAPQVFPSLAEAHKVPFFQCHGRQDPVLPLAGAVKLFNQLKELGLKGTWFEFSGGHEIPLDALAELQKFLKGLL